MPEQWRDIPGYEGSYQVSDLGRVRSLTRTTEFSDGRKRTFQGQVLKPVWRGRKREYAHVVLKMGYQVEKKQWYVHRLVLLAFVGPCPEGLEARHGSGGSKDNRLVNLSYGTSSQNTQDRYRDGTACNIPVCRFDGKVYRSMNDAAKDTGIHCTGISNVIHGRCRQLTAGGFSWERV
jgi:hypothetical protein